MAFPWIFESNFEAGTNAEWDSEQDTGALLDFPHYTTLAAIPGMEVPYRGAYCMRVDMGDTNDHTVREGDIDIADGVSRWIRFALYLHTDVAATANDEFNIFEWQQAGGTVEASMGLNITASTNAVDIGVGDGLAPSTYPHTLSKGVWHIIEAEMTVGTGGAGTLQLYVDGTRVQNLSSLTNAAAVGRGDLGTSLTLATTTGTILFDEFVMDDAQIGRDQDRFSEEILITKTAHAFIGPGVIETVTLISGAGTDCTLDLYDSDTASAVRSGAKVRLRNAAANELVDAVGIPVRVHRGCYVVLAGTNPRAIIKVRYANAWGSTGAVRAYANSRTG